MCWLKAIARPFTPLRQIPCITERGLAYESTAIALTAPTDAGSASLVCSEAATAR